MTSIEALEAYSSSHSETVEELLEWPYRRFNKAFSAWQRRNAVDEIENRKNLHVSALYANANWDDKKNPRDEMIESLEKYYEAMKDYVWEPEKVQKENEEMKVLTESDPFLKAGKRSLERVVPVKMPGQESIEKIIDE